MKRFVHVEDPTGTLTKEEIQELSSYIPDRCLCNQDILDKLKKIKIVDYGDVPWEGKWDAANQIMADGSEEFIGGQIILNIYYAKLERDAFGKNILENLEDALCHEYGHHWTLCWAAEYVEDPLSCRYLLPYYRARNIDLNSLNPFYEDGSSFQEYLKCDKEVVAEDFKVLFTPCNKHMMEDEPNIGKPNRRVRYFLSRMVAPNYV